MAALPSLRKAWGLTLRSNIFDLRFASREICPTTDAQWLTSSVGRVFGGFAEPIAHMAVSICSDGLAYVGSISRADGGKGHFAQVTSLLFQVAHLSSGMGCCVQGEVCTTIGLWS